MHIPRTWAYGAACALLGVSAFGQSWTQLSPSTAPGPRRTGGMAWDPVALRTLQHGGLASNPTASNAETWSFDGTNWTQLTPATTPPNRWGHQLVTDTRRQRIVMFGGRSPSLTAAANDTWEWNGSDWTQVFPAASPAARAFYGAAYDERRGKLVIYGSQSTFNGAETWEYDGSTWTRVLTPTTFASRESPAMCYDAGRGVIVLFGGWYAASPATMYADTWEYDGHDWSQRNTATIPIARYRAAMTYDAARGRVVLYGGFGNASALTDTWEYDGNDWTQVGSIGPARSTECYMSFDRNLEQVVHFGGSGPGGNSNETNVWSGPTSAIFAAYGTGCIGGAGMPVLQAPNAPRLGQVFQVDLVALSPAAVPFLIIGYGNTDWASIPLPLDLGLFGFNGCALEVALDATIALPNLAGAATLQVPIPAFTATLNAQIWLQGLLLDPQAANGALAMSNAAHTVVGS